MKRNRLIRKARAKLIRAGLRSPFMGKSDFQVQKERTKELQERINTELHKVYEKMEDSNLLPYSGIVEFYKSTKYG